MGRFRSASSLILIGLALAACGGDVDEPPATADANAADAGNMADAGNAEEAADSDSLSARLERVSVDPEGKPVDYLTYGAGAFPVRFDRAIQGPAAAAVLDGRTGYAVLTRSPTGPEQPITFTVELPAETTVAVFGVPPQSTFGCCVGAHIDTVTVEGSASSPDDGYVRLAHFRVDPEVHNENQLLEVASADFVERPFSASSRLTGRLARNGRDGVFWPPARVRRVG